MAKKKTTSKKHPLIPVPLLNYKTPVDWWFLFKLNADEEKGDVKPDKELGLFDVKGWTRPAYEDNEMKYSQHYLYASSRNPSFEHGRGVLGTSFDPLGSTFYQVYNGSYNYVLWNDQFYDDPRASGNSPWGHSKGMVAWNDDGEGFVMQVSTPSWPGSGSSKYPRQTDGNTLGFVRDDNIQVSQHFYALKINKDDLVKVLKCMINARVVTGVSSESQWNKRDERLKKAKKENKSKLPVPPSPFPAAPNLKQVINNGGPEDVQELVKMLGKKPKVGVCMKEKLSSGVVLLSKPSDTTVPPWQLVSSLLGGVDLRVATWWAHPQIYSSSQSSPLPKCWDKSLKKPGAVEIATSGRCIHDEHTRMNMGFIGTPTANGNHAKLGVSTSKGKTYSIFGDMNQQGAYSPGQSGEKCSSSQNGRGGMFFVMDNKALFKSLTDLLTGESAPTKAPPKKAKPRKAAKKKKAKK